MPTKNRFHIPLRDIPPEGKSFLLDDAAFFEQSLAEFHIDCRLEKAPVMEITVLPMDEGWLLRGHITADCIVPCCRCANDTPVRIDEAFEDYAQRPDEEETVDPSQFQEGDDHILFEHGALMLDLPAIAWEQFALALPSNKLCKPDCKGLCPQCGADLNKGPCSCPRDEGDPRLAVLRNLKVEKQ